MIISGTGWRAGRRVWVRFTQPSLVWGARLADIPYPAVTGLVVEANQTGRFVLAAPDESPCAMDSTVTVRDSRPDSVVRLSPRVLCHERPHPNPPAEQFEVRTGRYLRAIFVGNHIRERYELQLGRPGTVEHWTKPISRSKAVAIALHHVSVAARPRVIAQSGCTGVGPGGLYTQLWQVWVDSIRVPHWGLGHEVLLVVKAVQRGDNLRPGRVLASWYTP